MVRHDHNFAEDVLAKWKKYVRYFQVQLDLTKITTGQER